MTDYLTTEEVAARLRTTVPTLCRKSGKMRAQLIAAGLKSAKVGRRRLYIASTVDAVVERLAKKES